MSVGLVALAVALGAAKVAYALEGGALQLPGPLVFVNAALRGRPIGGLPLDGGGKAVPGCQPSR